MSEPGTGTFHVAASLASSRWSGTEPPGAARVKVWIRASPSYSRTRTSGVAVLASLARTNTRRNASRPAISGTSRLKV